MFFSRFRYPDAIDPSKVGTYTLEVFSGGGYFYDKVLEYRVWSKENGQTSMTAFATYKDAEDFALQSKYAAIPLVLVWQEEHINEPEPGRYVHITKPRITEWQTSWLKGSQGSKEQIPVFLKKNQK